MPEPENLQVRNKEEIDLPWGGKFVYYNCIVGGVIDNRFLNGRSTITEVSVRN